MKKSLFILSLASLLLVGCSSSPSTSNSSTSSEKETSSLNSNSVKEETSTSLTSSETSLSDSLSSSENSTLSDATSSESLSSQNSSNQSSSSESSSSQSSLPTLDNINLYMIGDSTCANYDLTKSNTSYYYQIQGFGTTIKDYFSSSVNVVNLGVGGASSKSFATLDKSKDNYNTFKNNIKSGDYAIITFGHNDEKATDIGTSVVNDGINNEGTFQYYLYNNFIKVALEKGATPILATPIARYDTSGKYEVSSKYMHNTPNDGTFNEGNYAQSIRDLAEQLNLTLIDTTNLTGDYLRNLTPTEAKELYGQPTSTSYDGTHINEYGAQMVGYMMAKSLKESSSTLGQYVSDLVEPTKSEYLKVNPSYVEPSYVAPSDTTWSKVWKTTSPWHGSAFGNFKSNKFKTDNYSIVENSDNTVTLSDDGTNPSILNSEKDSFVMYFQKINKDDSFTLEAKVTIDEINENNDKLGQTGCGIMVRDDMYIDQYVAGMNSHYAATGFYGTPFKPNPYTYHAWARNKAKMISDDRLGKESVDVKNGDEIEVKIVKNDSSIKTYYKLKGTTDYVLGGDYDTDITLTAVDTEYVYAGLFISGGLKATFSNINLSVNHVE